MTPAARKFVGPLTFEALGSGAVYVDHLATFGDEIAHTDLTSSADALLVAPASANTIAKIAHGFGDDPVSTVALALRADARLIIAPAMNPRMWNNPAVRDNIEKLRRRGAIVIGPCAGDTACGDLGVGRMSEPDEIVAFTIRALSLSKKKRILILSGPTREYLDDVRFLSNGSSGKFGAALADAAFEAGHDVTVISGPAAVSPSRWIKTIRVTSAEEMLYAAREVEADVLFSPAAIADYAPAERANGKPAKSNALNLKLRPNPDILSSLSGRKIVAFAAESDLDVTRALEKARRKGARFIVLNGAVETMESDSVSAQFIDAESGAAIPIGPASKAEAARRILELSL